MILKRAVGHLTKLPDMYILEVVEVFHKHLPDNASRARRIQRLDETGPYAAEYHIQELLDIIDPLQISRSP